jgi:hypothetical protein
MSTESDLKQTKTAVAEPGSIFVTGRPLSVTGGGGVLADEPLSTDEDTTNGRSGKKVWISVTPQQRCGGKGAKAKWEPKMH